MLVLFISLFVLALVVLTYIAQLYVTCLSLNWNEWTIFWCAKAAHITKVESVLNLYNLCLIFPRLRILILNELKQAKVTATNMNFTTLRSPNVVPNPSGCRLSIVCDFRSAYTCLLKQLTFWQYFAPSIAKGLVSVIIFGKNNRVLVIVKVNWKGVWKWRFSTDTRISVYFGNDTRYGHSYNERWIGTTMRSIERCHF